MSVAEVHRISTTKVQPASYIHKLTDHNYKRIDLNPWDLVYLRQIYMQRGFVFTRSQSRPMQEDEEDMISLLKTSLSYALDHFFPLAGRLGIEKHEDDKTFSVYINCNCEGAEFIHATADISIDDIISQPYTPPGIIDPFFSLNGVMNYEGQSHPLLAIQITELRDGVFIGCSTNHSVCDGTSFWRFINLWSEICRSSDYHTSCPPPVVERWFISDTDCPIRLPSADEFLVTRNIGDAKVQLFKGYVEKCFRFTKPNIAKIKARANSEIISQTNQKTEISSLQAVLAHIWTAVLRARSGLHNNYDETEETLFGLVMDNRTKLIPPLPETYFGNSGSNLLVTAKDSEVLQRGFGFLASLLNEAVNSFNDEKIRSTFESRTKTPVIFINSGDQAGVAKKNLWARGSHRFNMYGNDFGRGRPIAVKTGMRRKSHGMTTVNEGPVKGSIDIEINLTIEVFKAMENDAEFMKGFSI
ncbi:hypothetical protein C5167_044754 [Papaver somniferum]|uniref:protein ENHANCED PSEUDOMONAS SUSCEPTIBILTY 1-like n=1 Tax=Papaver somniferum TaxID=3469 RepID=UPI000E6F806F|nr:protein ENHANCED PSEUDOMONAS SUSCEPTIBILTY 1-like [Papaver somniferum]RZC90124.1 hypothetical protein C5167_044754 [Papaver somniferum]